MIVIARQPGKDSQVRTAGTGLSKKDSPWPGQSGKDCPERTARIGLLDLEYFIGRAARTGQSGHQRGKSRKNP